MNNKQIKILGRQINYFCDPGCVYLNPKETDQNNTKEKHFCHKYKKTIYHEFFHPHLVKPFRCVHDNFKLIKKEIN